MRAVAARANANGPDSGAHTRREPDLSSRPAQPARIACDLSRVPAGSLQRKLVVGASGSVHEREADRAAAQAMGKGGPATSASRPSVPLVQARRIDGGTSHASVAPPLVHQVIASAGQPLDTAARTFMESRYAQPFDGVRVHTDGTAAESARSIRARAYTVGRHMVFGQGQYAPHSAAGRELIAHELAHVMQQGGSEGVVQRAEVDDRSCAGLTDIETDLDKKVNDELDTARKAAGKPFDKKKFASKAFDLLAGSSVVGPIEQWIEDLPATKASFPSSLSATKYSGATSANVAYTGQSLSKRLAVVRSHALIHGICAGADKVGHFFQQGLDYARIVVATRNVADAESAGRSLEIQMQGLAATGVYSNADQAANRAGLDFWADVLADPEKYKFAIKTYITAKWNEQSNPSFYETGVGGVVWKNLLTGPWQGPFTSAKGTSAPIDSLVNLSASTTNVTGTYEWPAGKPTNKGKITSGTIKQRTTSVSGKIPGESTVSATPVTGVTIDFEWAEGTSKGKGIWASVDEQTLDGTWGIGASNKDGGTWKLKKS